MSVKLFRKSAWGKVRGEQCAAEQLKKVRSEDGDNAKSEVQL
jgi:hypothetical protein